MKYVPIRDSKGNLAGKALVMNEGPRKESIKAIIKRLTQNGEDIVVNIVRIAHGIPLIAKLPDGRESEPIVPTAAVQLAANQWLAEQLGGKAVMQNEVARTELEGHLLEQIRALSDEELAQRTKALLAGKQEVVEAEVQPEDEAVERDE